MSPTLAYRGAEWQARGVMSGHGSTRDTRNRRAVSVCDTDEYTHEYAEAEMSENRDDADSPANDGEGGAGSESFADALANLQAALTELQDLTASGRGNPIAGNDAGVGDDAASSDGNAGGDDDEAAATNADIDELADEIRDRYSDLLDTYGDDPDAMRQIRACGRDISALEDRGIMPQSLVRRGRSRREPWDERQ